MSRGYSGGCLGAAPATHRGCASLDLGSNLRVPQEGGKVRNRRKGGARQAASHRPAQLFSITMRKIAWKSNRGLRALVKLDSKAESRPAYLLGRSSPVHPQVAPR